MRRQVDPAFLDIARDLDQRPPAQAGRLAEQLIASKRTLQTFKSTGSTSRAAAELLVANSQLTVRVFPDVARSRDPSHAQAGLSWWRRPDRPETPPRRTADLEPRPLAAHVVPNASRQRCRTRTYRCGTSASSKPTLSLESRAGGAEGLDRGLDRGRDQQLDRHLDERVGSAKWSSD